MRVDNAQQTFPIGQTWHSGLTIFVTKDQPLCIDSEGWGPISPIRYDFTPCFLDVWILSVAAWGVFAGAAAVLFLIKKRTLQEVTKNWHFYAKLVRDGNWPHP